MTLILSDVNILLNFMSKICLFLLSFVLSTALFFYPIEPTIVFADEQNLNLPSTIINPGSFYYPLKRLFEKGQEKILLNSQSKLDFYRSQLKTRLAELNYVVEKKILSEVQSASERFAYQAGILSEVIKKQTVKDREGTIKTFQSYNLLLEKLRDKYKANTSFWMLIQHDINSLNILSDQLK